MDNIERNFLIYEGEYFTVEFYFTKKGKIEAWKNFCRLEVNEKADFLARVQKLADSPPGTIHQKTIFNLEEKVKKIWAIKFNNNRFCSFFYKERKIIITNAYKKQSSSNRREEVNQIKKAIKMKADYVFRVNAKIYY